MYNISDPFVVPVNPPLVAWPEDGWRLQWEPFSSPFFIAFSAIYLAKLGSTTCCPAQGLVETAGPGAFSLLYLPLIEPVLCIQDSLLLDSHLFLLNILKKIIQLISPTYIVARYYFFISQQYLIESTVRIYVYVCFLFSLVQSVTFGVNSRGHYFSFLTSRDRSRVNYICHLQASSDGIGYLSVFLKQNIVSKLYKKNQSVQENRV